MDKKTSYQTLKNITKNPNEVYQPRINLLDFDPTRKPVLIREFSKRNLDVIYGPHQSQYRAAYGHFA